MERDHVIAVAAVKTRRMVAAATFHISEISVRLRNRELGGQRPAASDIIFGNKTFRGPMTTRMSNGSGK
jgi:hypothetical protein